MPAEVFWLIALVLIGAGCYAAAHFLLPKAPEPAAKDYSEERRLIKEGKGEELLPRLEAELVALRESSPFRPILNGMIGGIHLDARRYGKAQEYLEKAVKGARTMDQSIGGPGAPRGALSRYLNDLGVALSLQGKAVEAEEVLREALTIRRERAAEKGLTADNRVGATLANLGMALERQSRFEEAAAVMEQGIEQYAPLAAEDPEKYGKRLELMKERLERVRARNPENSLY